MIKGSRTTGPSLTFQMREDLGDYPLQDRRELIDHHVEAFNTLEFHKPEERLHAAQDVAQTVFKPLHRYAVETHQLHAEFNIDPDIVRRMEERGITNVEAVSSGENNFNIIFQADDKFAKELVEETGLNARIIGPASKNLAEYDPRAVDEQITYYQKVFTDTLTAATDENHPESVEKLWDIFNEAYDYSRREKTGDAVEPKNITEEELTRLSA